MTGQDTRLVVFVLELEAEANLSTVISFFEMITGIIRKTTFRIVVVAPVGEGLQLLSFDDGEVILRSFIDTGIVDREVLSQNACKSRDLVKLIRLLKDGVFKAPMKIQKVHSDLMESLITDKNLSVFTISNTLRSLALQETGAKGIFFATNEEGKSVSLSFTSDFNVALPAASLFAENFKYLKTIVSQLLPMEDLRLAHVCSSQNVQLSTRQNSHQLLKHLHSTNILNFKTMIFDDKQEEAIKIVLEGRKFYYVKLVVIDMDTVQRYCNKTFSMFMSILLQLFGSSSLTKLQSFNYDLFEKCMFLFDKQNREKAISSWDADTKKLFKLKTFVYSFISKYSNQTPGSADESLLLFNQMMHESCRNVNRLRNELFPRVFSVGTSKADCLFKHYQLTDSLLSNPILLVVDKPKGMVTVIIPVSLFTLTDIGRTATSLPLNNHKLNSIVNKLMRLVSTPVPCRLRFKLVPNTLISSECRRLMVHSRMAEKQYAFYDL